MREQFRVDLRGLVDVLSHHLYSSERVYLRELVQNARDAIAARTELVGEHRGAVEICPAWGADPLIVRDNGIGLTAEDMRAMIGSTSKRDDFAAARGSYLGQFGIGLLSAFLVADSVEVISRSARSADAPTVRWVGHSDGTFTIGAALTPLPAPGTEVRLRPRHGAYRWCEEEACLRFAAEFAELLDIPVHIGDLTGSHLTVSHLTVSQQVPPWKLTTSEQLDWCRERFGFEAMGIIPLDSSSANVTGLAFVLPYTARPGYRTGDRIYSKGMLVADTDDLIVPRWAFFCRAVIDAGDLPLTASREGLQESTALQLARDRIGFRLLTELILVHGSDPEVYREIIDLHSDGLKALAVQDPHVRDLLRVTLPYETTLGERTIEQLLDGPGPVPYIGEADTYHALHDIAAHAGVCLINASGLHEADLLKMVDESERNHFREVDARDVIELVNLTPLPDHLAMRLVEKAERALVAENVAVRVASFEPSERPALWWPATPTATDTATDTTGPVTARTALVLNAANATVKRLLDAATDAELHGPLYAIFIAAMLLSRARPTDEQAAQLSAAVLNMIERASLENA